MLLNRLVIAVLVVCTVAGCASSRLERAHNAFIIQGDTQQALDLLDQEQGPNLSKLLFYMEKGLLLHQAGRLEESIAVLRNATDLMQKQDYLSVSQQTASLLVNDWLTAYKGEYCERLWVHTYLMVNYLMLHRYEDALVEAKQAAKVMDAYPEALSGAHFSMALIGFCYEILNEFNDAYIAYKRLYQHMPNPAPICGPLLRTGWLSGIHDPVDCHAQDPETEREATRRSRAKGELVLFVSTGAIPEKVPGNILLPPGIRFSFPRYPKKQGAVGSIGIYQNSEALIARPITTSLDEVARASLGERAKQIILKETARVAAKEAIVRQVGKENDAAGWMARMVMIATEEPDTRSWRTLPADNAFLRLPLEPGSHRLRITVDHGGKHRSRELPPFTLEKGARQFFAVRLFGSTISVVGEPPDRLASYPNGSFSLLR